jgi:hypothetical protein
VRRAYYYCAACHRGDFPWDRCQGLTAVSFTPRVKRQMAQLCARLTYREAGEVWQAWTGQELAESTLEAVTAEVSSRLRAREDARTEAWFVCGELPPAAPLASRVVEQRAYLSFDAAKAHVDGEWHDIKIATFSRAVRREGTRADGSPGSGGDTPCETQYLEKREEAAAFARRVYAWTLSLGAEWI